MGGHNPAREEALARLARRGLLSYVVGGPWSDPAVQALCLSPNISAQETAALYRRTRVVVNLFRSRHHYNAARIPATSLNPRVYEAAGCGALVISERRPELAAICPEMPAFDTASEMEVQVERYLREEVLYAQTRKACIRRLASHTYEQRLADALGAMLGSSQETVAAERIPVQAAAPEPNPPAEWRAHPESLHYESEQVMAIHRPACADPGSERGLISTASHENVVLEFDVHLQPDTEFIAKIHQPEPDNQLANSYHVFCRGGRGYLAKHNHVFQRFQLPTDSWITVTLAWHDGTLLVRKNGVEAARARDELLPAGYCFVGVKGGTARLRNLRTIHPPNRQERIARPAPPEYHVLRAGSAGRTPAISIVTTVYDRVECLARCLRSTAALGFQDYEQIVVADSPPPSVLQQIVQIADRSRLNGRLTLATLNARHNDWGIAPAAAGLHLARGRYLCFLSDDNGYLPWHFDRLFETMEADRTLGFVYSSCLYDGRTTLSTSPPRPGRIDLGQPLFRRELFDRLLGGALPFHEFGWDWRLIESFLRSGARWRHINDATFIFRLARYPHLIAPDLAVNSR